MTTLRLKNINMMSREQFEDVSEPVQDELYAISGSGFGFPSSNYKDLELGASGTEYIAPANGYFQLVKATASTNQYISYTNNAKGYGLNAFCPSSGSTMRTLFPAKKNDPVTISYSASGTTNTFRFIYAEGE
jgi:hypothetical protein